MNYILIKASEARYYKTKDGKYYMNIPGSVMDCPLVDCQIKEIDPDGNMPVETWFGEDDLKGTK